MPDDVVQNMGCAVCDEFDNPEIQKKFSKDEWNVLKFERETIRLEKGEYIIKEGANPKGIYCIKKGVAKLYKIGLNGKEQILRFAKPGDIIGYRSILCNEPFGASATALEPLEACFIPEKFFLKLLEHSPKLAFDMLKRIAFELGEAAKTITILAQKSVRERLAEVLLLLEKKLGVDEYGFIRISLTREEVANLVGTATESAIRLISEFKSDGLIEVDGRKIKLLNYQKLKRIANIKS